MSNGLLNDKYELVLEVLSPLHVGEGNEKDWVEGADFVQKEGKLYKLNMKKVAGKIGVNDLANFMLKRDSLGLIRKLGEDISVFSEEIFEIAVSSTNPVKSFIKSGLNNAPFIPGSSVKGALRSILFKHLRDQEKDDKDVFGTPNEGDEFMRFFKISDVVVKSETTLCNTKIFNLFDPEHPSGGWKHGGKFTNEKFKPDGFNTIYEVLNPGAFGYFNLSISPMAYGKIRVHPKKDKKDIIMNSPGPKYLFSIINNHTKSYISKQIDFFEKYPNAESDKIIDNLKALINRISADNSTCIFKMAAGSGFHSITGDWRYQDFTDTGFNITKDGKKKNYKSRKIAVSGDNFQMMGFVEMRLLTEEEKKKIQQQEEERKAQQAKAVEEARLEKERILEKKRLAEEQIRLDKEAKEKALKDEEERIAFELKEFQEKQEKEKAEMERRKKLNLASKETEKEIALKEGLSSSLETIKDYDAGERIISDYKRVVEKIPPSDYKAIESFLFRTIDLKSLSKKQSKRWENFKKGNWGLIRSWVDDRTAKEWFDQLTK